MRPIPDRKSLHSVLRKLKAEKLEVITQHQKDGSARKSSTFWTIPKVHDWEHFIFLGENTLVVHENGALTNVIVPTIVHAACVVNEYGEAAVGTAILSDLDQYNKRTGLAIATGRALSNFREGRFAFNVYKGGLPNGVDLRDACRDGFLTWAQEDMDFPVVNLRGRKQNGTEKLAT